MFVKGKIDHIPFQRFETKEGSWTSATSANHVLSPLKRMLNLAVKWELIEKNPAGAQEKFKKDSGDTIPINWRHMRLLHSKSHVSPYYLYCVPGTSPGHLGAGCRDSRTGWGCPLRTVRQRSVATPAAVCRVPTIRPLGLPGLIWQPT